MATARAQQGDTLDAIAWRQFGRTAGVVEQLLQLNPGLADQGPIIATGTLIQLPDQPATNQTQALNLWD
ncbi:phage tail protein [Pseudomonas abyssi]|uniref:Phage tail protein n=1 Tax=Pseudomonas abyssi TaxID=170540 RepID=A0A2A3MH84_9PSED|nr:tail protein X [Pseudomonas abyssi]PBK04015.1 phage tail protein [Pseudomonas abyssi]